MDYISNIKLNHKLIYGRFIDINNQLYIHYRYDKNNSNFYENNKERIKFVKLVNKKEIDYLKISLDLKSANHNLQIYNIDNKLIGFGGQCIPKIRYKTKFYDEYKNILKKHIIERKNCNCIKSNNYKLCEIEKKCFFCNNLIRPDLSSTISYKVKCPIYANGIYTFHFKKQDLNNLDKYKCCLILNGIHKNRSDGHYGYHSINGSIKDGLTVYDSNNSLVYNKQQKIYYLYVRANLGYQLRFIQYSTSDDLKNWSKYNLININNIKDLDNINIYFSNFFYNQDFKTYFGLLAVGDKQKTLNYGEKSNSYIDLNLYISNDCVNWTYRITLKKIEYHNEYPIFGNFIKDNSKYLIYIQNFLKKNIYIYSLSKVFVKDICNLNILIIKLFELYILNKDKCDLENKIKLIEKNLVDKQIIINKLNIYIDIIDSKNKEELNKNIKNLINENSNIKFVNLKKIIDKELNKNLKINDKQLEYFNKFIKDNNKLDKLLKVKISKLKIKEQLILNKIKKFKELYNNLLLKK